MLFFGAQNFHQTSKPETEEAMARIIIPEFKSYCRLVSYAYPKNAKAVYRLKTLPDIADQVIVQCDSGAYTDRNQKSETKVENYIQYLQDNEAVIDYAINLDRIGDGQCSYENFIAMKSAGLNIVPVFHLGTDTKYLCAYLEMADYIGISLPKGLDPKKFIPEIDDLWEYYLTDRNRYPVCRFHLLGVTSVPVISRYPWWSYDNSAWAKVGGFGMMILPKSENGIPIYNNIPSSIPVSSRSIHKNNHIQNQDSDIQRYFQARITSAALQFGLDHDLDDHQTRYAINMAHFYKVAANQPEYPWSFQRGKIRNG